MATKDLKYFKRNVKELKDRIFILEDLMREHGASYTLGDAHDCMIVHLANTRRAERERKRDEKLLRQKQFRQDQFKLKRCFTGRL